MNFLIVQLTRKEAVFARFQKRKGALVFAGGTRHDLGEASLPEILAQAKKESLGQERVILCLPPQSLFLREVELPITDRKKIRDILPLELRGETVLDTDDLVFDGLPLDGGKVLAIWAKRHDVAELIETFKAAGLEPEFITASLFHWQRLVSHAAGVCAVTDGESVAMFRNGKPLFFRPLQSDDPAEISRTIASVELAKGLETDQLLKVGSALRNTAITSTNGLAAAPVPLAGELAEAFPAEGEAAVDLAGTYATARACMAGEIVNFRSGDLAYTAGQQLARRKLRLTAALAAACVLLVFGEAGLRYMLVKRDLDSLNLSIATIYRNVFPTRKKAADEVAEVRSEIKRLGGGSSTGSALAALARLADAKGDDLTGIYEAEIDGEQVRVKGDARSVQAVNDFKAKAAASFTGAEVTDIKTRPDGAVTFAFHGTFKGETK